MVSEERIESSAQLSLRNSEFKFRDILQGHPQERRRCWINEDHSGDVSTLLSSGGVETPDLRTWTKTKTTSLPWARKNSDARICCVVLICHAGKWFAKLNDKFWGCSSPHLRNRGVSPLL